LQISKVVSGAQRFYVRLRQFNAVFNCFGKHHLGLKRALDVEMELRFGELGDEVVGGHGKMLRIVPQLRKPALLEKSGFPA
jgi:hypothetical protein